ncbi:hypothetical protein FisN_13Lh268 [Fistulifera solaris]|uniref:CAAX prenyl protease 2/Lysostaphin resistance protein A-like domain-containing protein n=1 Tax=Fistulifera solaris TaxID=1519565 RepID=A0A1Z5KM88_FISSO|nr:hypothetical protein FisN_13Lh268 [Fistulifera solaris]|eukprot:GAX27182.1 hypothetical protein FisN_13Lh268 [Fistulifera solaris]
MKSLSLVFSFVSFASAWVPFSPTTRTSSRHLSSVTPWVYDALKFRTRDYHEEHVTHEPVQLPKLTKPPKDTPNRKKSGVNLFMIEGLCKSQLLLLCATTAIALLGTQGNLAQAVTWSDTRTDPFLNQLLAGILAALPMIAISHAVENSSRRDAHYVNFSTTNMAITLFGRRHTPSQPKEVTTSTASVIAMSLGLVLVTSIAEEVLFRGYVPTLIHHYSHSLPTALIGQGVLFGLGHAHPHSRPEENRFVVGLQTGNGLLHGIVCAATGSLIPCIVSHCLYDWHVLASTWHHVNNQMDWTEEMTAERNDEAAIFADRLSEETRIFLQRFYYAFDSQHAKSLSLSDVQRAIAYAFSQDKCTPDTSTVASVFEELSNTDGRLTFSSFVQLLFTLRSQMKRQPA